MKKHLFGLLAILFSSLVCFTPLVKAQTITFDEFTLTADDGTNMVPFGYSGLTWTNVWMESTNLYPSSPGYLNGAVSPLNVGINAYGSVASFSSASPFTLNSLYATAAWMTELPVIFTGSFGGTELYSFTGVLSSTSPSLLNLNWSGIDTFTFVATQQGGGMQIALDNISINNQSTPVPEPSTYGLMGATALLGMGYLRRRTVKKA